VGKKEPYLYSKENFYAGTPQGFAAMVPRYDEDFYMSAARGLQHGSFFLVILSR
jgi:hypothetical protein